MTLFKESLEEILNYYEGITDSYRQVLQRSPQGSLLWQENHGKDQLLHYCPNQSKKRQVITKDEPMQRLLARKEFARRSLQVLEPNVETLRRAMAELKPFDPQEILGSMRHAYSKLPEDYFFDWTDLAAELHLDRETEARIERHRDWGNAPYEQSDYKPWQKRHSTSRGLKVRSKSEALIIESLYHYHDIPHRYEQVQQIGNLIIAPDLTFEGYDHREFYLEHLGMMDDPEYAQRNFRKLASYYSIGLIPGDNLLLTFDRNGTLDLQVIQAMIQYQIIPRL
ncbi:MAG: hypothetical protein IJ109_09310 [Firmicutes bacterium]|nr:hypothetical protein [Bacillota bacterium]